jgi:glucoamylase
MSATLDQWIAREYPFAATAMLRSVSPLDLVKTRHGFGQTVQARPGAIVASAELAAYDPDPDYFFHWYRDSAIVVDALRVLYTDGSLDAIALKHLQDFVAFSRSLQLLDGRALVAAPQWRAAVSEDFRQYLRDDAELATVHDDAVAADTRVNADGSLDFSKWARPQHDGPPLRALALLRWWQAAALPEALREAMAPLIESDLEFTHRHWHEPSFDIWEEERGLHYYTLRVSYAALESGAAWLASRGRLDPVQRYRAAAAAIRHMLDDFWSPEAGHFRSRVLADGRRSTKELDIAVILAAIHAGDRSGEHSVQDPRMHSTLARLERLFDTLYKINRHRPADRGAAMGRYAGDVYYSGGAYYFSTLGAAEFCFRAAAASADAEGWRQRGDAFLATVQAFTPASGELSEQFDQCSGAQTSARHLAWSYAALISCVAARRALAAAGAARP